MKTSSARSVAFICGLLLLVLTQPVAADKNKSLSDTPPPDGRQNLKLSDGRTGTETVTTSKTADGKTVTVLDQKTSRNIVGNESVRIRITWTKDAAGNIESVKREEDVTVHHNADEKNPQTDSIRHKEISRVYDASGGFTETSIDKSTYKEDGNPATETESKTVETFDADSKQLTGSKSVKQDGVDQPKAAQTFDPKTRRYVTPEQPKSEENSLQPAHDTGGNAGGDETAYLPDVAGPSSQIVASFNDPASSGPSDVMIAMIQDDGTAKYYRARTDARHHLAFKVAEGVASILLFKGFHDGKPDDAAAKCEIARDATVPQTDALSAVPQSGPAIVRASTAYERGGSGRGIISMQTRGADPSHTSVLLDGTTTGVDTLAASDVSVKARLADDVQLGRHSIGLQSNGKKSNAFPADVVSLRADPIPPGEPGAVETLTVHCDGLPPGDAATMTFTIGGAAQLVSGQETETVPVEDGVAKVQIRGTHGGAALVRFHLHTQIRGF